MRALILTLVLVSSGCAHMVVGSKPDYTHYAATALEAVGCAGLSYAYVQSVKHDNQANKTVLFFVDEVCLTSLFLDIAFEKVERQ
jgi:hypothetical protein